MMDIPLYRRRSTEDGGKSIKLKVLNNTIDVDNRWDAFGRLYTVLPKYAECFYLRLLLINIRGPTSFQELKTVNEHVCSKFREACQKLNLLENDAHWDISLADASNTAQPQHIRTVLSIILTTCFPANPEDLWGKHKDYMSEDILNRLRRINANPNNQFTSNIYNEALILIEDVCLIIANKSRTELEMIAPNRYGNDIFDRDIQRETHFDVNELQTFVRINPLKLVLEQRTAYDTVINAISNKSCGLYFLDALGETGKTFLISIILATIKSQNNITLAIASSVIAANFLDGGRTAHSALKLPLNMQCEAYKEGVARSLLLGVTLDVQPLCYSSIAIFGPMCQMYISELSFRVTFYSTTTLLADERKLHSERGRKNRPTM
ncbi:ATP-dependent DNA helicase [Trichonephila clavipes]|nr:ATP-dependent DNA helicase [Trichonephila clavipes]